MTRVIKFRGKQKSWIYGGLAIFEGQATIFDENCVANSAYEVDYNSVGQFAGFLDKKEEEIFEGDIVKYHHSTSKFLVSYKAIVVFYNGSFCLFWEREMLGKIERHIEPLSSINLRFLKVIGNIFDTKIEFPVLEF